MKFFDDIKAEAQAKADDPDWYPPRWAMHLVAFTYHPVRYARYFIKGVRLGLHHRKAR